MLISKLFKSWNIKLNTLLICILLKAGRKCYRVSVTLLQIWLSDVNAMLSFIFSIIGVKGIFHFLVRNKPILKS